MMSQESYIRTPTFSHCSDLYMANFLRSGEAFCLPKEESSTVPVIDPDYDNVLPPTLNEQCAAALQMPDAIGTYRLTTGKCRDVACWPINETLEGVLLTPNENTNCEDGKVSAKEIISVSIIFLHQVLAKYNTEIFYSSVVF